MVFSVLPAIDVADGRLAMWTVDGPEALEAFGGDPVTAARAYAAAGARWVHVVDLDHALRGGTFRADLVAAVAAEGLVVQASGGIADAETVDRAFDAGAQRVVLGSGILVDEAGTLALLGGSRRQDLLVGLEVRDGAIAARGDQDVSLEIASTLGWLVAAGAPGFLVTAVTRVGDMAGPDLELIRRVVRAGRPVMAAGGIASVDHLRAAKGAGAAGAVIGRAALEGGLDLDEAFSWAGGS